MHAFRALLAAAALALAACAPPPPPACAPAPAGAGVPAPDAADGPLVSSLSVEAGADSVTLQLQVTNTAASPVQVTYPSGQTYDFFVRRGGQLLWQWSETMRFMQSVRTETFGAGETRTWSETWRVPPGTRGELTAEAVLVSSTHPVRRTTAFRLP